jgi:hypothetical protein
MFLLRHKEELESKNRTTTTTEAISSRRRATIGKKINAK